MSGAFMLVHHFPLVVRGVRPVAYRTTEIAEMRRIFVEAAWARASLLNRMSRIVAMPAWPLVALISALAWQIPRHGGRGKSDGKRPRLLQLWDQLRLAVTANMWPHHYYMFELYAAERRARAHGYLLRQETRHGIYTILKDASCKNEAFSRKDRFAAACAAAGLPHVPMLAAFDRGAVTWFCELQGLPATDLFVKPPAPHSSHEAERWRWRNVAYHSADGDIETSDGLLRRLLRRSMRGEILLMPCLRNHPALAGLNLGALASLRVLTCRNEQEQPETMATILRFPLHPGMIADNFRAGGLAAMMDLQTGRLAAATDTGLARDSAWRARHPITGAPIEGATVPFFAEAKALAEAAHRALGDRVVIGWDIAILGNGPVLLDASGLPDLDIVQRCGRVPLAESRLCGLVAHHLRRRYPVWRRRHGLD
jgi:hypothetical protein